MLLLLTRSKDFLTTTYLFYQICSGSICTEGQTHFHCSIDRHLFFTTQPSGTYLVPDPSTSTFFYFSAHQISFYYPSYQRKQTSSTNLSTQTWFYHLIHQQHFYQLIKKYTDGFICTNSKRASTAQSTCIYFLLPSSVAHIYYWICIHQYTYTTRYIDIQLYYPTINKSTTRPIYSINRHVHSTIQSPEH